MENILNEILEENKLDRYQVEKKDLYFIDESMKDYFQESLLEIKELNKYIYIFRNTSKRDLNTMVFEYFRATTNLLKEVNSKNIKTYLVEDKEILEFSSLFNKLPISLQKYSPDFDYILSDFENSEDKELKKMIKLRIFTEIIKYIFKDDDLKDLTALLLK